PTRRNLYRSHHPTVKPLVPLLRSRPGSRDRPSHDGRSPIVGAATHWRVREVGGVLSPRLFCRSVRPVCRFLRRSVRPVRRFLPRFRAPCTPFLTLFRTLSAPFLTTFGAGLGSACRASLRSLRARLLGLSVRYC